MGLLFGLVKRLFKISIYFLIFAAFIVFIPNLPPYTKFTSIDIEPLQPRSGPLAHNEVLNNVEKAYKDKLLGPEVFQEYKGELYTSLATGEIVKISPGGHVTFVTKIGQPCSGLVYEHICGRPLGFQIDEIKEVMYIADAYHGIWKVDLKTDKKQLLVSPRVAIGGRIPKMFNSVAIGKNGDLYWTDSSSDFHLKDGFLSLLVDPSGRVLHYNAAKNESKVLLDNLWFANGLVVSPDYQFLVIAETCHLRLLKYYIDGPKKGKSEVLVSGLPGYPDNVRSLPDGSGVLVGLYTTFEPDAPLLPRSLAAAPLARKFVARLARLAEIPFEYLNTVYPHVLLDEVVYNIGHFKSVSGLMPKHSGLVQVKWDGTIVASYYNTDGSIDHISDAIVYRDRLYTGCPHNQNFIGSLPAPPQLKKAFEKKLEPAPKQAKPVETPKPKAEEKPKVEARKEAPKPTTTTPKPEPQKITPVETAKPTPAEKKPKPVDPPKPTPPPSKPTTPPSAKTEPPKAQPKQEPKATPKPEIKTTTPTPKVAPKTTPPPAKETKPSTPKPEVKAKPAETVTKPKETQKPVKEESKPVQPEQIPIKEEIPSDTVKPTKDTLKVIKKGGPAEIPNPNLN